MRVYFIGVALLGFFCLNQPVQAQFFDSLYYSFQNYWMVGPKDYQAHYIRANRNGIVDPNRQFQGVLRAGLFKPFSSEKLFDIAFGVDLIGDYNISDSYLQQLYVKVKYGPIQFRAGKYHETIGQQIDALSTGSLALSNNARPLPKISIGIPDYTAVPLTYGYFEIKGMWSHGWFEEDRFVQNPFLHEKYIYGRLGGDLPVKASTGLVHFAQWGGQHPRFGQLDDSFSDFAKVFFGREGGVSGDAVNALGNHLGILDFGLLIELKKLDIFLYNQYPFEDQSNLHTIFLTNFDRLVGVSLENKSESFTFIKHFLYEFITTKWQSGPGLPDVTSKYNTKESNYGYNFTGRDDFYNNFLYKDGWTYQNRILGTPLFLLNYQLQNYIGQISDTYGIVVNNRIVGHHLGWKGQISDKVNYRFMSTYTHNHGTYAGLNQGRFNWGSREDPDFEYELQGGLEQFYFMAECYIDDFLHQNLQLQAALGVDAGQMTDNFGLMVSLRWKNLLIGQK
ncbi:MAG: capsule assembly Wzi family protein [Candidatus Cyclobacteriaceae bacterium M3_2C_046]